MIPASKNVQFFSCEHTNNWRLTSHRPSTSIFTSIHANQSLCLENFLRLWAQSLFFAAAIYETISTEKNSRRFYAVAISQVFYGITSDGGFEYEFQH